jgi:hypothetical protein
VVSVPAAGGAGSPDRLTPTPAPVAASTPPPPPPPALTAPAAGPGGRPAGQVSHWEEAFYVIQGGDNFVDLSQKFFGTGSYAQALFDYNYAHPQTTDRFKQQRQLQVGEKIFVPEKAYMERIYGRPTTAPAATSPAAPIATGGGRP